MRRNTILIGLDPGFSSLGWAALCLAPWPACALRCNALGVFETEKATKKQNVLATDDNLKRAREIASFLDELLTVHGDDKNAVVAICTESMSWPRNAATTAKMGIAWGCIAYASHRHRVPIFQTSPQELKKQIAGSRAATKEEVERGVCEVLARSVDRATYTRQHEMIARISKTKREHPVDALAAAIVCSRADAVQASRRAMT